MWAFLSEESNFHKCLLLLAFDLIRNLYNVTTITFLECLRELNVCLLDLYVISEIILSTNNPWLGGTCLKRIREVQERLLESEIWKDLIFYDILAQSENDALRDSKNDLQGNNVQEAHHQIFIAGVTKLATVRLKDLCSKTNISPAIADKVEDIPITFKIIIQHYRQQPQCIEQTYTNIQVGEDGEMIDIIGFYNKHFVPPLRSLFPDRASRAPPNGFQGTITPSSSQSTLLTPIMVTLPAVQFQGIPLKIEDASGTSQNSSATPIHTPSPTAIPIPPK
ncbi:hypothetical protein BC829DRAFT_412951 [Chytridium lagenaria]|nr:hypothetical protein BC829DRAFT_412951 [Chytridium lagenaria]